jgi:hypothetical protein
MSVGLKFERASMPKMAGWAVFSTGLLIDGASGQKNFHLPHLQQKLRLSMIGVSSSATQRKNIIGRNKWGWRILRSTSINGRPMG